MKTIFTTLIFILCSFFSVAQEDISNLVINDQHTLDSVFEASSSKSTKATNSSALKKTYSFQHSKIAATQLRLFLAQNTVYPEIMYENNKEGKVVLAVNISRDGKIESAKIIKGLTSEFDQASLDAVKLMKRIALNESRYYGNKTIYVPVIFKITEF